jgi:hypothetical protein
LERILIANDGVAIDLKSIIRFLNSLSSYFIFELYGSDVIIEDTIITEETYEKLNIEIGDDVSFLMIFTDKKYDNNYFFDPHNGIVITSFFAWEYLTTLPKSNGAAFFVVDYITLGIDSSFRHTINDNAKPECMFDFLMDKTGIDSSMRASLICPDCNKRIKKSIKTEEQKLAFENIKCILNEIGTASKWDEELITYWKKKEHLKSGPIDKKSVFISYSHADSEWLQRVKVHLKPLERNSVIDIWEDTRIKTGDNWKNEIEKALDTSQAAILLVSADFLASDFIVENELPQLLKIAQEQGTRIFQVIISPCCFDETEQLSQFQAVNSPSQTLIEMDRGNQERLLLQLAKDIIHYSKNG